LSVHLSRSLVVLAALILAGLFATVASAQQQALTVTSVALTDGGMLDTKNANSANNCGGGNVSPPLAWSGAPAGTPSFAVVMIDPDGGKGLGSVHWVAYGIDPSVTSLAEGEGGVPSQKCVGGNNGASMVYRGPCPPAGDQPHHYVIGVYALDLAPNALQPGLTRDAFLEAIRGHNLAEASIVGRHAR
jgi:Raf kinase inhibitor-like YbhB/YbcL family protein